MYCHCEFTELPNWGLWRVRCSNSAPSVLPPMSSTIPSKEISSFPYSTVYIDIFTVYRVSYRILSWGEKQDGSRMIVACESTLMHA